MNSFQPIAAVNIFTKTWSRDSHGLYDYESNQTKTSAISVFENSVLIRKKLEIRSASIFEESKDDEYLLDVKREKTDKFLINNPVPLGMMPTERNINEMQNKIWYVIKHDEQSNSNVNNTFINTNEDYHICLNDIVKLGRVKYAANEINIKKSSCDMDVDSETKTSPYNISEVNYGSKPVFDFIYKTSTPPVNRIEENMCRICLTDGSDYINPLVELCKCTGGIKYTHYNCLKIWMQTKLSKKENEKKSVTSYNIKSFNCEICKTPFPFRFVINGNENIYDLIDIIRPVNKNYIILESLNQLKDNNNLKSIHVINLDEQKITLGRGHESDVRINDISVSRTHASITFNPLNGKICIRDLKSKFGTLVLVKNIVEIKEKKIHLQIGRSYLEIQIAYSKDYKKLKDKKNVIMNMGGNNFNNNISQHGVDKNDDISINDVSDIHIPNIPNIPNISKNLNNLNNNLQYLTEENHLNINRLQNIFKMDCNIDK